MKHNAEDNWEQLSYFAVIVQVLQPLDCDISDVAAAKQDFT